MGTMNAIEGAENAPSPGGVVVVVDEVGATRVLVLSTIAFTLLFAVWLMFGVLGVPISAELHLTKIEFSWLTATAVLSGSIWRLPLGILTDRVGGRRLLVALLLVCAVPCLLVSYTHSYRGLLLCALGFGLAGNSFSVGIAWNAAWASRANQGFTLGVFGAGNVGASITKLIGPLLITLVPAAGVLGGLVPGGWRIVPVLYAALLVAMTAVVALAAPLPDRTPGVSRPIVEMLKPLAQTRTWRFGLYYVAVFGVYVALSLWLPSYYVNVYRLSLPQAALLTALFIFPASLLRPLGGWLSDRLGPRPVTYGVFVAMLAACLPGALWHQLAASDLPLGGFVACVELLGIAMGIGKASVYKYIPEYFPRDVGAAGGLVGALGALGGFLLPIGFGYLETASGRPESCLWLVAGLVVWCLAWLHVVVRRLGRDQRSGAYDPLQAVR
jgi:NNP family nitrate/nitrite transporter-like MFS transporter